MIVHRYVVTPNNDRVNDQGIRVGKKAAVAKDVLLIDASDSNNVHRK